MVFRRLLRDNIAYGKANATECQIEEAIRLANCNEFVDRFPLGLDTVVGHDGIQLSGGQKQRLALGRAIIRNPKILLLDEPTSALDSRTEQLLLNDLVLAAKERTTLMISHRPSTVSIADHILIIEKGKAIDGGSQREKASGAISP